MLIMLADGASISEVGMEIGRAKCTVKHSVVAIKKKLHARTIAHAVALAYHKGILSASC